MKSNKSGKADTTTAKQLVEIQAPLPGEPAGFLDADALLQRVPFSRGTLRNRMKDGTIPFIRAGGRRIIFDWPSVRDALLRMQRGGGQ